MVKHDRRIRVLRGQSSTPHPRSAGIEGQHIPDYRDTKLGSTIRLACWLAAFRATHS